jgi:hypothetical protein
MARLWPRPKPTFVGDWTWWMASNARRYRLAARREGGGVGWRGAFSTMNSETSNCRAKRSRARSIVWHSDINAIFRPRRSVL